MKELEAKYMQMFEQGEVPTTLNPYFYLIYSHTLPPAFAYRIIPAGHDRCVENDK